MVFAVTRHATAIVRTLTEPRTSSPNYHGGNHNSHGSSFNSVLSQLAAVHTQEMADLTKEHNRERERLTGEIRLLRDHMKKMKEDFHAFSNGGSNGHSKAPQPEPEPQHKEGESEDGDAVGPLDSSAPLAVEDIITGESFGIKEVWNKKIHANTWGEDIALVLASYQRRKEHSLLLHKTEGGEKEQKYICQSTICPNGNFRLSWDLVGLVLITLDLLTLPFTLAFQPAETWFSDTMEWINLLFWTGDMIQGFFLGYYEQGQYIDDHKKILKHYLKTWFVIDALVVWPEWLMLMDRKSVV